MLFLAIFVVSFSTLAFEVLLTRVFAIGQWNHLSFMVISIALFGFGASGTFLSLFEVSGRKRRWHSTSPLSLSILLCFYSGCTIISFLVLNSLPLDYFRLPVEPIQSVYLLAAYLILSLPFFISGLIIAIGYTRAPQRTGLIYFATMAGSASGALVPFLMLPAMNEDKLVIMTAALPLIPATVAALKIMYENRKAPGDHPILSKGVLAFSLSAIGIVIYILSAPGPALVRIAPSPYKALGQMLQFPQTQIIESKSSIRGRFDRVKTPYVRFAPGLSLKYSHPLPRQDVIYKDGDNPLVLYELNEPDDSNFAAHMLSFAAYALIPQSEKVLLIQRGGGSAVPCAMASGAERITIIEPSPFVADIIRREYPGVQVLNRDPRVYLAQNEDRYDIIHIENWGTSIPGSAALNQEYTFTIEAFREYLDHLTPRGIISISRRLLLPPSDSLRLWSTAYEALLTSAVSDPGGHLALIRNFDTFTLLVSKSDIDLRRIKEFVRDRNFDLVFLRRLDRSMVNKFHLFQEPYYYREINRLAEAWKSDQQNGYFKEYLLDVRPQSDRRPFPGRFMKWSRLRELYTSLGSRLYVLVMSGDIVVSLVFIEALMLTLFLLILPAILITGKIKRPTAPQISYFLGIGAGFMFVELYFIKLYVLIFGDPIISFTLVVSAILIFSSLGGLYSHSRLKQNVRLALMTLIGGLIIVTVGLEFMAAYLLNLTGVWRYLIALILMMPVGLLMGLPFPLGMRYILENPFQRAFAWSVNGCASVLSSIAAAQLAMSFGIPSVAVLAVVSYLVALGAIKRV